MCESIASVGLIRAGRPHPADHDTQDAQPLSTIPYTTIDALIPHSGCGVFRVLSFGVQD